MAGRGGFQMLCVSFIFIATFLHLSTAQYTLNAGPLDWNDASAACTNDLAVVDNEAELVALVTYFMGTGAAPLDEAWIGFHVPTGSDSNLRTVGGRAANFSNLWGTGAAVGAERCVKIVLNPPPDPDPPVAGNFLHGARWEMDDCAEEKPYICMDTADEMCDLPEDVCSPRTDGFVRDSMDNYCVWSGPDVPLNRYAAETYCAENGGSIFSIYTEADLAWLKTNGYFNDLQPWNAYYTGLFQNPGAGVPRFDNGYVLPPSFSRWDSAVAYSYGLFPFLNGEPDEIIFGSSLSKSGWSVLYFPFFNTWNLYNNAPWEAFNLLFLGIFPGGHRETKEAFVICEARVASFCDFNAPAVLNANKTDANTGHVTYTCMDGYSFSDDSTSMIHPCGCNATELKEIVEILRNGCLPIDPCTPNPCSHNCMVTHYIRNPHSYICTCRDGYQLAADGVTCEDINECDMVPNVCGDMGEGSACRNRIGTFDCFCYTGYGFGRNGKCEASSPLRTGTFQLMYGLPASCGDINDATTRQDLIDSVYRLATNSIFDSKVTVRDVNIDATREMTITLDIGGVVTLREQSIITYEFYKLLRSPGLTTGGSVCSIPDPIYFYADGIPNRIPVTDYCSLYDGLDYCTPGQSRCEVESSAPVCQCNSGFTGFRCETEIIVPTEPPPPPPRFSTFELIVMALLAIFGITLITLIISICIICASRPPVRPIPVQPVVPPAYGSLPPLSRPRILSRPFARKVLIKRGGFPIGSRF